jgi:hypothetical protein
MPLSEPCRRESGNYRKWFLSKEEAEAFAGDPANVDYHGDMAHLCLKCNRWHLSKPEWLVPNWHSITNENARIN